jgi:hypothetical protein
VAPSTAAACWPMLLAGRATPSSNIDEAFQHEERHNALGIELLHSILAVMLNLGTVNICPLPCIRTCAQKQTLPTNTQPRAATAQ